MSASAGDNIDRSILAVRSMMGCAMGALLLVILLIGGLILFQPNYTAANPEHREDFLRRAEIFLAQPGIEPADRALLSEVVARGAAPEASEHALGAVAAAIAGTCEDGAIGPEERALLEALRAHLAANPRAGVWSMSRFLWQHPKLQELYGQTKRIHEQMDAAPSAEGAAT